MVAQHEIDLGDVRLPAALVTRARGVQNFLKAHRRSIWSRAQLAQADVLDDDVDLVGRWVREERLDDAALVVLRDGGVGQGWLKEEKRVWILALNRGPKPPEVLHDELREEVAQLRWLRPVGGGVVLHGLGASDLVDPNNQRPDLGILRGRVEVERQQAERHERHQDQRDLQIGVHHQGRAVQLDELALRVLQGLGIQVGDGRIHIAPVFSVRLPRQKQPHEPHQAAHEAKRGRYAERDDQEPGELR